MMRPKSESILRAILYGGASSLLALDVFFLIKATLQGNFIPLVPILAGIFTAAGLLFVVWAEHRARQADKEDHRRVSRVAHQLEAPLLALQKDFQHLVSAADNLPAEARLKLKRMETKTAVLLENIRDVFLMLRAYESPISEEKKVYDLCVIVKDVIDRLNPLATARNVEITHQAHCQEAHIRVDRRLLMIALTHILENSIVYTLTPGLVNIAIVKGAHQVRVVIQDRGVGVKKKDVAMIFKPFARGEAANQFDPDGIGVGLTLSRLIMQEFGGDIRWRNRAKKTGVEVELVLPLASKA